jgi:hypothetical protein
MSWKLWKVALGLVAVLAFAGIAYASYADFFVATNGHVGIGTDQPTVPLHVAYDDVNVGNSNGQVLIGGFTTQTEGLSIGWNSTDKYAWMQSGNYGSDPYRPLVLQAQSGNVGINDPTPGSRLTVNNGDVELYTSGKGVVLHAPDGHCARLTLTNSDTLDVTPITCP